MCWRVMRAPLMMTFRFSFNQSAILIAAKGLAATLLIAEEGYK